MSLLESLATATTKIDFEIELSCVEEYIDGIYTKDFLQFALDVRARRSYNAVILKLIPKIFV